MFSQTFRTLLAKSDDKRGSVGASLIEQIPLKAVIPIDMYGRSSSSGTPANKVGRFTIRTYDEAPVFAAGASGLLSFTERPYFTSARRLALVVECRITSVPEADLVPWSC